MLDAIDVVNGYASPNSRYAKRKFIIDEQRTLHPVDVRTKIENTKLGVQDNVKAKLDIRWQGHFQDFLLWLETRNTFTKEIYKYTRTKGTGETHWTATIRTQGLSASFSER